MLHSQNEKRPTEYISYLSSKMVRYGVMLLSHDCFTAEAIGDWVVSTVTSCSQTLKIPLSIASEAGNKIRNPSRNISQSMMQHMRSKKQHPLDSSRGHTPWKTTAFFVDSMMKIDLATRKQDNMDLRVLTGFKSFSCVSTASVMINLDCRFDRI